MNTIITEQFDEGEMPVDIYQKLSDNRILFICDSLTDKLATDIASTLMLKDIENPEAKITLFINSDGGDIRNAFMIYDVINMIEAPVETVCMGSAADEAAIILAAGTPGLRLATQNAVIAVSQLVHDWMSISDLTDAKVLLEQATYDNKRMMEIFAKTTKKTLKQVMSDFERRVFMSSSQAVKYGLIDKVISFAR